VLAYNGEEVRKGVNCYELDISGSSVVLASVAAKKTIEIETKGNSVIYWLKVFLELSRLVMDRVRGCLGRLVGLGSKFNGFKPKNISKKPIIHLKLVCKSLGQGFKVFFSDLPFNSKSLWVDLRWHELMELPMRFLHL
jgi:predicted transcriptional regulator with HTH domain